MCSLAICSSGRTSRMTSDFVARAFSSVRNIPQWTKDFSNISTFTAPMLKGCEWVIWLLTKKTGFKKFLPPVFDKLRILSFDMAGKGTATNMNVDRR